IFKSVFVIEYAIIAALLTLGYVVLVGAGFWHAELMAAGVVVVAALIVSVSVAQDVARYLSARAAIERYNIVTFLEGGAWPLLVTGLYLGGATVTLTLVLAAWVVGAALACALGVVGVGFRRLSA